MTNNYSFGLRPLTTLLCLITLSLTANAQTPTITSFSPASAQAGTVLTINGTNFSTTAANNIVQFGSIRATVNSATANTLSVTVPQSAPNERISVTVNGKIVMSPLSFRFLRNLGNIITSSYLSPSNFTLALNTMQNRHSYADFDGDGRVEFVTSAGSSFAVARNTSTLQNISFGSPVTFNSSVTNWHTSITADFDADGKPDVLLGSNLGSSGNSLIHRNTSTLGNISFSSSATNIPSSDNHYGLAAADLNQDGLLDIIAANYNSNNITLYLNNSSGPGNISFSLVATIVSNFSVWDMNVNDFDGDGRPDVAVIPFNNPTALVYRNTTAIGSSTLSLSTPFSLTGLAMTQHSTIKSADLNGDNLPEIVIGSANTIVYVFPNTSSIGNIGFTSPVTFSINPSLARGLDVEDVNGDGFNDIIAMGGTASTVMQNAGVTGNITSNSFLTPITFTNSILNDQFFGYVVDLDNDGAKDIITHTTGSTSFLIRRFNLTCPSPTITTQPSPVATCAGTATTFSVAATGTGTLTYQWRKNGVNIPGAISSTYTIANTVLADTGNYSVVVSDSCVVFQSAATTISQSASLTFSSGPVITTQPLAQNACGGAITFAPIILSNGGPTTYQWQKNGVNISGATSASLTLPSTSISDTGNYRVQVSNSCGNTFSNLASLNFTLIPLPLVANGTTCNPGNTVILTNFGTVPSTHITRWYDDANFAVLLGTGNSLSRTYANTDTVYVRNEANSTILSGLGSVNDVTSGDDRSAIAVTQNYYYYTGDNGTVRYNMPALTAPTFFSTYRDAMVSTYGGAGTLYSLGSATAPWDIVNVANSASHIWRLDSALNPVASSAVAISTGPISTSNGSFLAGGADFILYRSGSVLFKINPTTGTTSALSFNLSNFSPAASESWASWGFAEEIGGNHYIYYKSSTVNVNGISRYHVESNTNISTFNPGSTNVISDLAALCNAPWYNRWYYRFEFGTAATLSTSFSETAGFCDAPMRFNNAICNSAVDTVVIVSTIPVISRQPSARTLCNGSAALFSVATSQGTNLSYTWRRNGINIANSNNDTLIINSASFADTVDYSVSISNGCINIVSNDAKLSIIGVNITSQPANTFNCAGEPISLNVAATGRGTLTYQWRRNNINIPGANSATYNIVSLTPTDTGNYTVVITDSCNLPITSSSARVFISNGPQISSISSATQVCAGQSTTINVSASGNGTLTYQWRLNGVAISGANASSYTINNASSALMGNYSVLINDNCGQTISNNINVSLNIITPPNVNNLNFCAAGFYNLQNLASVPSGYITRWYDDANLTQNLGSGSSLNRSYTNTDTVYARNEPNSTIISGVFAVDRGFAGDDRGGIAANQNYVYNVGDNGTARYRLPGLTNGTSLPIRDGIISTYGGNGTIYSFGVSSGVFGSFSTNTATHLWFLDSNLNQTTSIALSSSVSLASGGFLAGGSDFILYRNSLGTIVKINPATGLVTTLVATSSQFSRYSSENWASWGFAELIDGNHYITYRSNAFNPNGISRYHVEGNTNIALFIPNGSDNVISDLASITTLPWYNRWAFHFEGGTPATLSSVFSETLGYCDAPMRYSGSCFSAIDTIIVFRNLASITTQPTNQTVCAGTPTRLTVAATGVGLTFQWFRNGVSIPGATDDTLTISNASNADSGSYFVNVINTCGTITSNTVQLNIRGIRIITQPQSIRSCGGDPVTLSVSATGSGVITYQWRRNGNNIPGAITSSYTINALTPADTGTYTVVLNDSCAIPITSQSAVVTLSTGPTVTSLTPNLTPCLGAATSLSVSALTNGTTSYQWLKDGVGISGANNSTYNISSTSVNDAGNYTVVINDLCGQTTSSAVNVSIFIVTPPEVNNTSVCLAGNSVSLNNTIATPSGYTTRWYDNGALTILLGTGSSIVRTINSVDTFFVRNEANTGFCVSIVDTVIVTITSSNTWTGATNTNWFNATNWSCAIVPNTTSDALIPANAANMPIINSGLTANVRTLTIASGATVSMLGTSVINVSGNIIRNGTFTCPSGTVNFINTSSLIQIPGGNYFNISLVNNAIGAILLGSVRLDNNLTFNGNCILRLDTCNFTQLNYVTTAVSGAGTGAYLSTNGTGKLRLPGVGSGASLGTSAFAHVGNSTYNPAGITNTGTIDTIEISVIDQVANTYAGTLPQGAALNNNVVNRTWIITETNPGGSNLNLFLGWIPANETSGFNRNNCYVANYTSLWNLSAAGASALSGNNHFRSRSGITTTGIFGVGSNGALPVELIDFKALKINNNAKVLWSTISEKNNHYFDVERSFDGTDFTRIGRVNGKGNSSTLLNYEYLDVNALILAKNQKATALYYRLKQVDFDGKTWQSEVAALTIEDNFYQPTLQPNPYNDKAYLNMFTEQETKVQIIISDVNGRVLQNYTEQVSIGQQQLKLRDTEIFSAGVYFVQIINKDHSHTFKLIKQ